MLNYKEYIYAIYQEHSFSKAAQKLFVSQPWLSSVVKKVEQEIKTPLFDRSTNPISLTPAGEYYIQQVEKVMAIEEDMREHFAALSGPGTQLHIGSSMFFCTYVLPRLFQEFREQNPQITLTLTEGSSAALSEKLLERKLDFFLEARGDRAGGPGPASHQPGAGGVPLLLRRDPEAGGARTEKAPCPPPGLPGGALPASPKGQRHL